MIKIILCFAVFIVATSIVSAQKSFELEELRTAAQRTHPSARTIDLIDRETDLKLDNLAAKHYPELSLYGMARYQSDVTEINLGIDLPPSMGTLDMPTMPNDRYQIGINATQTIWDGGVVAASKKLERAEALAAKSSVETNLYSLREKVDRAFFGAIVARKQIERLKLAKADLDGQLQSVRSGVKNGVLLESQAEILEANALKIEQSIDEVRAAEKIALAALSELTGESVGLESELILPNSEIDLSEDPRNRPEFEEFRLEKEISEEAGDLVAAKYMPKIYVYGKGFYGKPGLDMFGDEFKPFYEVGLQFGWNFWTWGVESREKQALQVRSEMIDVSEDAFSKQMRIELGRAKETVSKIERAIEKDEKIISLRKKIVEESKSKLSNGTITSSEYVLEFNALTAAEIELEIRKIQLIQAKYNWEYLTNSLKD